MFAPAEELQSSPRISNQRWNLKVRMPVAGGKDGLGGVYVPLLVYVQCRLLPRKTKKVQDYMGCVVQVHHGYRQSSQYCKYQTNWTFFREFDSRPWTVCAKHDEGPGSEFTFYARVCCSRRHHQHKTSSSRWINLHVFDKSIQTCFQQGELNTSFLQSTVPWLDGPDSVSLGDYFLVNQAVAHEIIALEIGNW